MQHILIIGSGPAALMAATQLIGRQVKITIVDHKPAAARKFLVAGDGGFNLTHSEPLDDFVERYDRACVKEWVRAFTPSDFREWLSSIGIETYVGSSGKVFPVPPTRPIAVLNAWLKILEPHVDWRFRTRMIDFDAGTVTVQTSEGTETLSYDALIFALGGASWKKTGSDGAWFPLFEQKGIPLVPFGASNSGLELVSMDWALPHEGKVFKNVRLSAGGKTVAGDVVITRYGIEGKPVYAMNNALRNTGFNGLEIDFKPQLSEDQLTSAFLKAKNVRAAFKALKLPDTVYDWLKAALDKETFTDPLLLARQLKAFAPDVQGFRPIDEVISTVGGIAEEAIDAHGKLRGFERIWCAGEMIDWDAPTGGYLLQGCVASGFVVGKEVEKLMVEKL
jgi:uncharacterized flavoprotein (TIGR03862 family)